MAARYWVGGTGLWTAAVKWSTTSGGAGGSAVPTAADDVTIDSNSGTPTISLNDSTNDGEGASATCKSLTCTGSNCTFAVGTRGTLYIANNVVATSSTWNTSTQLETSGIGNLTTGAGTTINGVVVVQATGVTTLSDALVTAAQLYVVGGGSLNANNFNVTCSNFTLSGLSSLTMGSGTWTLTGTGGWSFSTGTVTPGTSTIKFTANSASNIPFAGGAKTYNNIWVATSGSGEFQVTTVSNTFNDFKIDAGRTVKFTNGITTTVTSFTALGTAGNVITIGSTALAAHTLSKSSGTVTATYCTISYSTAGGGATWNAQDSTNGGNNTGWNFTTSVNSGAGFFLFM